MWLTTDKIKRVHSDSGDNNNQQRGHCVASKTQNDELKLFFQELIDI